MGARKVFLAVDLGASNGRVVAGEFDGERLQLEELHRFANGPVSLRGALFWDILRLFSEIQTGIGKAAERYRKDLISLGVDSWGVDYGLLDARDQLIGNPYHYRDPRTEGMQTEAFACVPRQEIYRITGIQFLFCNTLYQLLAEVRSGSPCLSVANRLLFVPDLINFWLTGARASEETIASTSQLVDPWSGHWAAGLMERLGLPTRIFGDIVPAGTNLGALLPEVAELTQAGSLVVVAPGCHDTASAVAAVPAQGDDHAYISSGTWSLMGLETRKPIINEGSLEYGFSNEGGVCGTFRFLKNISGLWQVQECRRVWAGQGEPLSFAELTAEAAGSKPFSALLDPDDPVFQTPGDMPAKVIDYCRRTGQEPPAGKGPVIRSILESLALKYRLVFERLEKLAGHRLTTLHLVGGGTRNELLNQFAANAVDRPVITGPVEATSIGNILMQLLAMGQIRDLGEGRELVRHSFPTAFYSPVSKDLWEEAGRRFRKILRL